MSLSGAMNVAVAGVNAQSRALGNISDNVANVQTTGYKRVDTAFQSLITQATPQIHAPGGVLSRPVYVNDVQGTIQSTGTTTNLAIAGEGMFAVSQMTGVSTTGSTPPFAADPLYTRAGDFTLDAQGYLVNGSGYYLNGWSVDPTTGAVAKNTSIPIQITQLKDSPQQTSAVTLSANLPTQPNANLDTDSDTTNGIQMPAQAVTIYDAQGTAHNINLNWSWDSTATGTWKLAIAATDSSITLGTTNDPVPVDFYTANAAGVQAGSIKAIDGGAAGTTGADVTVPFTITYASGDTQQITLDLGKYGVAQQLTNFTGTDIDLISAVQDGLPPGSFRNLTIGDDGMLTLNYDNGNKKTVFQIPVAQFSNYDGLQAEAGNAYSASPNSGSPALLAAGDNGTGVIHASSVEGSNVDVSAELVKMIQAQEAYNANARVISVSNEMLKMIEQIVQ